MRYFCSFWLLWILFVEQWGVLSDSCSSSSSRSHHDQPEQVHWQHAAGDSTDKSLSAHHNPTEHVSPTSDVLHRQLLAGDAQQQPSMSFSTSSTEASTQPIPKRRTRSQKVKAPAGVTNAAGRNKETLALSSNSSQASVSSGSSSIGTSRRSRQRRPAIPVEAGVLNRDWISGLTGPTASISFPLPGDVFTASSSAGLVVVFDGSKSQAEAGSTIVKHHWRISGANDQKRVTIGPTVSFKLQPGSYTARLAVTSDTGQASSDMVTFKVTGPAAATQPVVTAAPSINTGSAAAGVSVKNIITTTQPPVSPVTVVLPPAAVTVNPVASGAVKAETPGLQPPVPAVPPTAPSLTRPPVMSVPEQQPPTTTVAPVDKSLQPPAAAPSLTPAPVTPSTIPAAAEVTGPVVPPPTPPAVPPAPPPATPPPAAVPAPPVPAPVPAGVKVDDKFCNPQGDYDLSRSAEDWDDMQACCRHATEKRVAVSACSSLPPRPPSAKAAPTPASTPPPTTQLQDFCTPGDYDFSKPEDRSLWTLCCQDAKKQGTLDTDCDKAQWK